MESEPSSVSRGWEGCFGAGWLFNFDKRGVLIPGEGVALWSHTCVSSNPNPVATKSWLSRRKIQMIPTFIHLQRIMMIIMTLLCQAQF